MSDARTTSPPRDPRGAHDSEYDGSVVEDIQEIRRRILAEFEDDLSRHVDHLTERQKRHADRLITEEDDPRRARKKPAA